MNSTSVHASIPRRSYRDASSIYTWLILTNILLCDQFI
jgi:hypothetical protein